MASRNSAVKDQKTCRRLLDIVNSFRGHRVAVLGDLVSDEFVYGNIERISREAPVPILRHERTVVVPGGGGNAIANLRALGARPLPVGLVGKDEAGRRLLAEFRALRIERSGILRDASYCTPTKTRILAGGVHTRRQQLVRVDRGGTNGDIPSTTRSSLRRALRETLRAADGLLVADYGYGCATPELLEGVRSRAKARSIPLLVDSRARVGEYREATGCTPNQEELERALDVDPFSDAGQVEAAGRKLLRRTGHEAVLVTRGAEGMCLLQRGRPPEHIPPYGSDEVADVTGAGDTVIATFTLALLAGASFSDASRLSNYAAGLVVMKAGTATVTSGEVASAVVEDFSR